MPGHRLNKTERFKRARAWHIKRVLDAARVLNYPARVVYAAHYAGHVLRGLPDEVALHKSADWASELITKADQARKEQMEGGVA